VRLVSKMGWLVGVALSVAVAVAIFTGASASGAIDLAGTWQCCGAGGAAPQNFVITSGTGSLKGTANAGGTQFATITGTLKGNKVTIVTTYTGQSYVATFVGTVAGGGNTMSGTWTAKSGGGGTWSATRAGAAPPPPVLGKAVDAAPVSGVVLVKLPGQKKFTRLTAGDQVPLGSQVDATHGVVAVTGAKDRHGHTTTGRFYAGEFRVGQKHVAAAELTVLTLAGPKPSGCTTHSVRSGTIARRRRPKKRSLWGGSSKGNFRTVGSYASATERGTKWLTQDTCAGTLIHVTQGAVAVADFPHHRTLLVHAPHSFLAHPGAGG
jgi:hypothetical protein